MQPRESTTPEAQAAREYAKSAYIQGTTARVIAKLNGGMEKLKDLDVSIKGNLTRVSAQLGKQLYDLNTHVPLLTSDINNTISSIRKRISRALRIRAAFRINCGKESIPFITRSLPCLPWQH